MTFGLLEKLTVALSVLAVALALLNDLDLCLVVLQIVTIAVVLYPCAKGYGYTYARWMTAMLIIAISGSITCSILDIADTHLVEGEFWQMPDHVIICEIFQVTQAFTVGLMAVINTYCRGFRITKRWVIIAAMFISLCYGVLTMFGNFFGMYFEGLEVISKVGKYTAEELNARMMSCAFIGVFTSAILAFSVTQALRGREIGCFLTGEYNEPEPPPALRRIEDRDGKVGWGLDDAICVIAFVVMISMTVESFLQGESMTYEVNTGLLCGFTCLLPLVLKHLRIMRLPTAFNLLIVIAIFIHSAGVLFMSYDTLKYYDTLTHTVASVTVSTCVFYTLVCYHVLTGGKVDFSGRILTMMISLVMIGFSAYWESFEFIADMAWGTGMQYSPFDTVRDTICNTFGSFLVIVFSARYLSEHTPEDMVESFDLHPMLRKFIQDPFDGRQS